MHRLADAIAHSNNIRTTATKPKTRTAPAFCSYGVKVDGNVFISDICILYRGEYAVCGSGGQLRWLNNERVLL